MVEVVAAAAVAVAKTRNWGVAHFRMAALILHQTYTVLCSIVVPVPAINSLDFRT